MLGLENIKSTAGSSRAASPATSSESEQEEEAEVDLRSDHDYSDSEEDDEDDVPDKGEMAEDSDKEPESDSDFDVFGPQSSARKRKAAGLSHTSPAKRGRPSLLLKPSAAMLRKAAERKERQARRVAERKARMLKPRLPLVQQRHLGMSENATPFEKARSVLHVGCTPDYLPCRDNEYAEIEAYLEDAIDEGIGSCICTLEHDESMDFANLGRPQTSRAYQEQARQRPSGASSLLYRREPTMGRLRDSDFSK